jgi:hypothetical protein
MGGPSDPVGFTYTSTPLPAVATVSPDHGNVAGGQTVVLTGTGFSGTTAVTFGFARQYPAPSFTVDSDSQLTVVTPAVPMFGDQPITVQTSAGLNQGSYLHQFTFEGPPVLFSVAPPNGPLAGGTNVHIFGSGLNATTGVTFGGVAAASYTIIDDNDMVAVAPPHAAGDATVNVSSALGTNAEAITFTYTTHGLPTIDSVTPNTGLQAGGYPIVIKGSSFAGTTEVRFGWGNDATFTIDSDTQITATAPPGQWAGSFDVIVTNDVGSSYPLPEDTFTYIGTPHVAGLSTISGPTAGGTSVTIIGSYLEGADAVSFGGVPATSFRVDSINGTIDAVTPPHASGVVAVVVSGPDGSGSTDVASTNMFVYLDPGQPLITQVNPPTGPTLGGTQMHLLGQNLDTVTSVTFGGTSVPAHYDRSIGALIALSPPGALGSVSVAATSPAGTSPTTPSTNFEYDEQPIPSIYQIHPDTGPTTGGNTVTIQGRGFSGTTSVTFGGVQATSFTVDWDSQLHAVVPPAAAAGTVIIEVTNGSGPSGRFSSISYQYVAPARPTVTSITPNRGSTAGGATVHLSGTQFTNATAVHFGTYAATFTVTSDGQIVATSPAVDLPYLYDITVTTPLGTSPTSTADWFLYRTAPVVWSVTPTGGPTAGGQRVTIRGDQFFDASRVSFGWNAANFTVVDLHTIIATVPASTDPGTVWLVVATPAGRSRVSLSSLYSYRQPGAPTVTSTVAHRGSIAGGQTVVLTSTGFAGATSVRFGTTDATSFTVDGDTQITAVVPPRATADLVNVNLVTPSGTNANEPSSWFLYTAS